MIAFTERLSGRVHICVNESEHMWNTFVLPAVLPIAGNPP